ncbi:RNA-directed DNA polymerase [Mitsuokella sp. UBA4253]|uniref:RNA-directed DNA polymerase n=1 Tax=Mitsuokella sp. UBA4253 TaxID=1946959 RepID=UPI00257F5EB5|nr:RNA-directed DNA polymerase [Mitsuokella sp. UBA4253]
MKRYGNLYDKITDMDNLRVAFYKAAQGKHYQDKVKIVEENCDEYLMRLKEMLENGTYHTSQYATKQIYEPKERTIYILPFYPDRIAHHAIMNVLAPIMDSFMIYDSYACRKEKGQHAGSKRCMQMVRRNLYCLKCDISKFYPSIDHDVLKSILEHKFKDKRLIALLNEIIDSTNTQTNVPIGNYLSQWFGNLYLNELDTKVKYELCVKDYIRYCDDFCFFSLDKEELRRIRAWLPKYLQDTLKLKLSKCELFPVSHGVDFLGYRHFPRYILVRKRTAKGIKKHLKETMYLLKHGRISKDQALAKIASAKGWIKHANSHHYTMATHIDDLWKEVKRYKEVQ